MWRRIKLAFIAFFRVLRGRPLPEDLVPKLPPPPEVKRLEAPPPPKPEAGPGALQLLGLLQREGRLVDFLTESIDAYEDAEIGAAVRDIHRGCRKVLDEHFGIEPVMAGAENEAVVIEAGFDPHRVRLTGNLGGQPPFKGTLRHRGWRAKKVKLPQLADGMDATILAPAEVEL